MKRFTFWCVRWIAKPPLNPNERSRFITKNVVRISKEGKVRPVR